MALFNNFPYTDLNDINLDYTLQKLESLYTRGEQLYSTLTTWQQATNAELEQWKAATESSLALWKTQTENSIDNKIQLLTAAINTAFTELRTQLEAHIAEIETTAVNAASAASDSATAAAGSATAAAGSASDAAGSASDAADTAESLSESLDQIATNTSDINNLKGAISNRDAKSLIINQAVLQCFEHVAWENTDGNTYYQELEAAINETGILEYISVVYTQGSTLIYADTPIESLRDNLVVTAHFSSGNTRIVTDYGLYGDLIPDTSSTVTVAYINKITTFSVTVTKPIYSLTSDSRTFQYGDKITVSKGNHIRLERSSHQFTGGCFINFSDMSLNDNNIQWQANTTAVNNLTTSLFTLSSGDEYTLSIKNLRPDIADMFFGSGTSRVFTNAFRKANADVSAFDEVSIRNGIIKLTSTGTVTDEMDVSCAFMYFGDGAASGLSHNITVEYDLELIINGIRVI